MCDNNNGHKEMCAGDAPDKHTSTHTHTQEHTHTQYAQQEQNEKKPKTKRRKYKYNEKATKSANKVSNVFGSHLAYTAYEQRASVMKSARAGDLLRALLPLPLLLPAAATCARSVEDAVTLAPF